MHGALTSRHLLAVIEAVIPVVIAARLVSIVRRRYVSALLSQDMAWYDVTNVSESLASFTETSSTMQTGMGDKLTDAVRFTAQLFSGIIIGFVTSWKLTLVIVGEC